MSSRQISSPKGFQLATVRAALETLTSEVGPKRFLVADEVGLGKTVVARTIIDKMMERRRTPLVVFYAASNLNIAHQNRTKLLELLPTAVERKAAIARADRLTLAASPDERPTHPRLHLYTLTPDTSFPFYRRRGAMGKLKERALIFRILTGKFPSLLESDEFARLCRGRSAGLESWNETLNRYEKISGIRELQESFLNALSVDPKLGIPNADAQSILAAIGRQRPAQIIGSFRSALAMAALKDVKPDLIIFDEFQKFRDLLIDTQSVTTDPLVIALRGGSKRNDPGLLLLSATPYRLYSSRHDDRAGKSHHQDFFELIRFLFGSTKSDPQAVEAELSEFGAIMQATVPDFARLRLLRDSIQKKLARVLSRTERPEIDENAANSQPNHPHSEIQPEDLRVFKHWVARLQSAASPERGKLNLISFAVPYWLSVPLPSQMLGPGYVAWRMAEKERRRRDEPALRKSQRDRLGAPKLWPHPQFRALKNIVAPSRLSLPWVAPSLPWWNLEGPWATSGAAGGKLIIFSRFKAVPPALASMLSFDLESSLSARLRHNYRRAGEAQPLQLKANRPTLLALFFPSPALIAYTDPRLGQPKSLTEVRHSMRRQVRDLLQRRLRVKVFKSGPSRPLWKLLPALEQKCADVFSGGTFHSWKELRKLWLAASSGQEEVSRQILGRFDVCAGDLLTAVTEREISTLAEFALSGPGVALGRALFRYDKSCITSAGFGSLLDACWNGLRPYLNRSIFHAALTRRGQTYMRAIPEAIVAGNFESVMDEHLWITSRLDADAISLFSINLKKLLGLREGRHAVHEPGAADPSFSLRCHAAMPFSKAKSEKPSSAKAKAEKSINRDEDRLRTDDLRRSFNSPFWPHVLATTSLGQEGLDFHVWCRQLLHWDLCASPLDLEQREGRIQRFGGLSVRFTLAQQLSVPALAAAGTSTSPWSVLAERAEKNFEEDKSGLSPWWSCPGEKIDRVFVVLPQSGQSHRFNELSDQRWRYRLALGQPHQQDFIDSVSQLPDDGRRKYALCLSAWHNGIGKIPTTSLSSESRNSWPTM